MFLAPEFWVAVSFVLFVVLLFYLGVPGKIAAALDQRSETIRAQIDEARRLREEAQARLQEFQRRQREAMKEAEEIVARARQEADRHREHAKSALENILARRREQALEKIARAEAEAVRQVRELAAELSIAAARRVLAEELAGPRGVALIDKAITELPLRMQ